MSLRRSFGCWRLAIYKDAAHDGAEKGVPCGTLDLVLMGFQGLRPWLISGVRSGPSGCLARRVVEREGLIKFLTVRNLTLWERCARPLGGMQEGRRKNAECRSRKVFCGPGRRTAQRSVRTMRNDVGQTCSATGGTSRRWKPLAPAGGDA